MNEERLKAIVQEVQHDLLERGMMITMITRGGSMIPFIRRRQEIGLRRCDPPVLRPGDVIVYRTPQGLLCAHRIMQMVNNSDGVCVITKGDSHWHCDRPPVRVTDIVGLVVRIKRGWCTIDLESWWGRILNSLATIGSRTRMTAAVVQSLLPLWRMVKNGIRSPSRRTTVPTTSNDTEHEMP